MLKDSKLNPKPPGVNLYSGTCREEWFEQEAKSLKPHSKETKNPEPSPPKGQAKTPKHFTKGR